MVRIKRFEICHKNGFGGFENDVLPLLIGINLLLMKLIQIIIPSSCYKR